MPSTHLPKRTGRELQRVLDASQKLGVSATDTATGSGEFHYDAHTAHTDLTATVLDCAPDAGGLPAADATAYWTQWSSVTAGTPGTAAGTIALPDGDVEVSYSGEVGGGSATTGTVSNSFAGVIEFAPPETYRSATIASGPPPSGLIAVSGNPAGLTQTIGFSMPVRDPLIAVVSMGSITQAMTWQLDGTPAVLSNGADPIGFIGTLTASDKSLTGTEGSGVVQLAGTFTAITFTTSPEVGLDWCGFTIGIRGHD